MKTAEEIKEKMQAVRNKLKNSQSRHLLNGEWADYNRSYMCVGFLDALLEWIDKDELE